MGLIKHILPLALLCFLFASNAKSQTISDTLEQKILNAQSDGRVVDNLNNSFAKNPRGEFLLAPQNKDLKFGIIIYNISIFPDNAMFSAGIAFRDPKSNQLVAFRADNIAFSNSNGLSGPVKLYLVSDVTINMGQAADIIIKAGTNETYAVFECKGLQEFGIAGQVDFNSGFILPVNAAGDIIENEKVSANFKINAKAWTDMVVQISMHPFQVKGLKNYVFNITDATMDLSETSNSSSMKFPEAYNVSQITGGHSGLWEGFYLQKGSVTFPEHFTSNSHQRVELGVSDLLIDEFGFSGTIFGNNLLDFEKGKIANWNFSIQHAEISLVMNELVSGRLEGDLGLPVLPDTSKLHYSAYIGVDDNYGIQVSLRNDLSIPAFKAAKVLLTPNSYIDMHVNNGKLFLTAELNGGFSIVNKSSAGDGPHFNFPSIAFQGFRVSNTAPAIDIEYLGLKSTSDQTRFSGFPLTISEISLQKYGAEKLVRIRFGLNLMEKISVKGGVSVIAYEVSEKLKFKKLEVNEIDVRSATSCFTLEGHIYFIKEDSDYGNGFNGNIKITIVKPKIEAEATVLFGTVKDHRYWYFDASVIWDKPGIPFMTGSEINGFMGGAYHGMREANEKDNLKNAQYGATSEGKYYVPDAASGLGLKAGIYIRSTGGNGSSTAFLAKVALELQFNRSNGLNKISFYGNVDVMTENNKTEKADLQQSTAGLPNLNAWEGYKAVYQPKGKIGGPFMMEFDFANKSYQANFAVYVQGIADDKIKGTGLKGLAGECSIYFGPDKWHFWIGTPQQPIGLKINMGVSGTVVVSSYFMAGSEVRPAEPLPTEITNVIGNRDAGGMRKLSDMASGNAFAFGSRLSLQIGSSGGENNVSIYASLKAIVGFDINVANYGKNTFCSGHNGPPGINGWFANGQLFAFLQGAVGASYNVGGQTGKVDLLTLTCASAFYCQGPNPFYANGAMAVQVSIAGIINKQMDLNFEIGEPCELRKKKFTDTVLILETLPSNGEGAVSTLAVLKTKFSVPIGKSFKDVESRQNIFQLTRYDVMENNHSILGTLVWNELRNEVAFNPNELLPGEKKIKVRIVVEATVLNSYYEVKNADGSKAILKIDEKMRLAWTIDEMKRTDSRQMNFGSGRKVIREDRYESVVLNGKKVEEIREVNFITSSNPGNIPDMNIAFTYPARNQLNYYRKISNKGFLELNTGQGYLVNMPNSKIMALFVDNKGTVIGESKVIVNGKKMQYNIPNSSFVSNGIYNLIIKRKDFNAASELGKNLFLVTAALKDQQLGNGMFVSSNGGGVANTKPKVDPNSGIEMVLLSYCFGVSKYGSLEEKLKETEVKKLIVAEGGATELILSNKKEENFDLTELGNNKEIKPLLKYEIRLVETPWFTNEARKIYEILHSSDLEIVKYITIGRDTAVYGLLPTRTVKLFEDGIANRLLQPVKVNQEIKKPVFTDNEITIETNLFEIVSNDLEDIKNCLIRYVSTTKNINTKELNRYVLMLKTPGIRSESGSGKSLAPLNNSVGLSSFSLIKDVGLFMNGKENTNLTQVNTGLNNEWVVKISGLKLQALYEKSNYPLTIYYSLPGDSKPISSLILNSVIK